MNLRSALSVLTLAVVAPGLAQAMPAGLISSGIPTRDTLAGTLEQGRAPMPSLCDRVREWHAERAFARARSDTPVDRRALWVVDVTTRELEMLSREGFNPADDSERADPACRIVRVRSPGAATLRSVDESFRRIAPGAAWAPAGD